MSQELEGTLINTAELIAEQTSDEFNYNDFDHKPQINGVELIGNKTTEDLGIDIPTKTSQLQNDSGFITSADVPTKTSELENDSGFVTADAIPTKTSQLQNDSGFITSADVPTKTSELENDSGFVTADAIPTKTSQLQNDSGFITGDNYYNKTEIDTALSGKADKSDTYTKSQVDTALSAKANASDTYTKSETDNKIVGLIDDNSTANNKAWSSSKITDEIINILPTGTASGSVASFNTSLALPLVSLKANVSATPSGVSEISLVHCGKNLYKYDENKVKTGTTTTSTTRAYYPLGFKGVSVLTFTANLKSGSSITASDYLNIGRLRKSDGLLEILSQFITPDSATTRTLSISSDDDVVLMSLENPTVIKSILSRYDVQIEVGSIATTYEAYNGNTEVINLGETIYNGGTFTQDNAGHRTLTADGTTINLPDGTPITTLIGTNNIYNDSGNSEAVYKKSINDAIAELQALFLS